MNRKPVTNFSLQAAAAHLVDFEGTATGRLKAQGYVMTSRIGDSQVWEPGPGFVGTDLATLEARILATLTEEQLKAIQKDPYGLINADTANRASEQK